MMTIRFIYKYGCEFVRPIQQVTYLPVPMAPANPDGPVGILDRLSLTEMDGTHTDQYEGTAFIMNEMGKTVAVYHLSSPPTLPVPQHLEVARS